MQTIVSLEQLRAAVGAPAAVSGYFPLDQRSIDAFADLPAMVATGLIQMRY